MPTETDQTSTRSTSPIASTGRTGRLTSCSGDCAAMPGPPLGAERVPRRGRLLVGRQGRRRPHRQPRLADVLLRARRLHGAHPRDPARADDLDVHRDGPAEARPAQGALSARLHAEADREHEDEIRAITVRVLDRLEGRESCDIVNDIAQPVVSRVIGSFMGIDEDDDKAWATLMNTTLGVGDEDLAPGGLEKVLAEDFPEIFRRCAGDDRRPPREPDRRSDQRPRPRRDRRRDARRPRDRDGLLPARRRRQRLDEGDLHERHNALLDHPDQMRELVDDPALIPGAIEECLRMFPAFANFRRTATADTEIHGQPIAEGDKVLMWYVSSNRDEDVYEDPDRFDIHRNPEHQAFGAGGRHFCLGTALARLELKVLFEETLKRYPNMTRAGDRSRRSPSSSTSSRPCRSTSAEPRGGCTVR